MISLLTFTVNRGIIVNVKSNSPPNGAEKENTMKTNYTIEIQRHNVTPAQFLAYVRRRLKATGGDAFCGCLDLDYFAAGSEPNYDTTRDGTHCISRSKPYDMQTYISDGGRLYNEICEFELDGEKTGHGYYYLIDAEADETTETAPAAEPETETAAEPAERAAEIADLAREINRLRSIPLHKHRVRACYLREAARDGQPTVRVGYCDLWGALAGIDPNGYTAGVYGWNCDVYLIGGLTICTGYRPAAGVRAVGVRELAEACRGADTATRDRLLAAWIVTNREAAREGARA